MNNRDYKTFRPGLVYHIFNRGNNLQKIFIDRQDYLVFLDRLRSTLGFPPPQNPSGRVRIRSYPSNAFDLFCYCLMPNHFHFLIRQKAEHSLSKLIQSLCTSYTKYFNRKHDRIGHLFQDTFKSVHVDTDEYLTLLSAYIHTNPKNYANYEFSSLPDFLGQRNGALSKKDFLLAYFQNHSARYRQFIKAYNENKQQKIAHLLLE